MADRILHSDIYIYMERILFTRQPHELFYDYQLVSIYHRAQFRMVLVGNVSQSLGYLRSYSLART